MAERKPDYDDWTRLLQVGRDISVKLDSIANSLIGLLKIQEAREEQRLATLRDIDAAMRRKAQAETKAAQYLREQAPAPAAAPPVPPRAFPASRKGGQ